MTGVQTCALPILLDRYVVAATIRRDGTDKFFPGKKYAYFPSVSLAWKLSNEPFMKHISWIDQLKIRGSYGQTGNDNLLPFFLFTCSYFEHFSKPFCSIFILSRRVIVSVFISEKSQPKEKRS